MVVFTNVAEFHVAAGLSVKSSSWPDVACLHVQYAPLSLTKVLTILVSLIYPTE